MSKASILIVEDEYIVALDIENSLSHSGYSIAGQTDCGEDAVIKARDLRPDLILMDIGLRGTVDGIDAATQIRRQLDLPVIFLTAYTTPTILERARQAEPFGYVVKPFEERELISNIEMALHKHSMEKKLRASENKFRGVIENSSDAIALADDHGALIEWNPAAECITGLKRSEVLGLPQWEVILRMLPEHKKTTRMADALKDQWNRVVISGYANGLERMAEFEIQTPLGERKVIQTNGFVIDTEQGRLAGAIMRDFTERRKMEDALRDLLHREQLLGDIIRQTSLMIGVFGLDGTIIMVNNATIKQTGYSEMEFLDPEKEFNLTPPELRDGEAAKLEELRQTKEAVNYQTEIIRKDGSRFPADVTVHPHLDAAGNIDSFFILASDISDRRKFEDERGRLIAELKDKNAELEQFTYTVSHDLKAPLITIRGFLGFLERDLQAGRTDRIQNDISRITDATDKMQKLIIDLLDLSRVGRIKNPSKDIPFGKLVQNAVEVVAGQLTLTGVRVDIASDLPIVHGDPVRLAQVLQNLIENAIKFMGDQPEPRIDVGQKGEEDGKAIFYVRDNGIGIAPEHHERIFGLFNKLDGSSDSTGIGLALVKRIVEIHGGRIWVESEAGKGAAFFFTLPESMEKREEIK
jgi:PAS domain S-box-containing protein